MTENQQNPQATAGQAPGSSPFVAPPPAEMNLKSLKLRDCFRIFLRHWRENPIVKRVWRKARLWTVLVSLGVGLTTLVANYMTGMLGANPFQSLQGIIFLGLQQVVALVGFALWIGFPIFYARWAYRLTFANDEGLQSAPLSFEDRLLGILTPGVAIVLTYALCSTPLGIAAAYFALSGQQTPLGMSFTLGTFIGTSAMALVSALLNILLLVTFVPRRLIAHREIGGQTHLGFWYQARPFLMQFLLSLLAGCAGGLMMAPAMFFMGFGQGTGQTGIWPEVISFVALSGGYILAAFFLYLMYFHEVKSCWVRDIPLARIVLFDNPYEETKYRGQSAQPVLIPSPSPEEKQSTFETVYVQYLAGQTYGPMTMKEAVEGVKEGRYSSHGYLADVDTHEQRPMRNFPAIRNLPIKFLWMSFPGNRSAVTSYYVGLASILGVFVLLLPGLVGGMIAILSGHSGLDDYRKDPGRGGKRHAIAGIVLGWVAIVMSVAALAVFLVYTA